MYAVVPDLNPLKSFGFIHKSFRFALLDFFVSVLVDGLCVLFPDEFPLDVLLDELPFDELLEEPLFEAPLFKELSLSFGAVTLIVPVILVAWLFSDNVVYSSYKFNFVDIFPLALLLILNVTVTDILLPLI